MTILDALDGPFRAHFPGDSWHAWRAFLAGLFGLDMSEDQAATWRACTGRQALPERPAVEGWAICGRRSGKSRIAAAVAAFVAATAKVDQLAPGEWGTVLCVATDRQQAGLVFGYIAALFETPQLAPLVVGRTADTLELRHGVKIMVHTASFRSIRGQTVLCAVLDEIAYMRSEESALPDVELVRALKPALSTCRGLLLGISSPWAKRGVLWQRFRRHFGRDGDVVVWQADSRRMNPTLNERLIADAVADDPEAAAEWLGVFRSDLETFLSTEVVDAVTAAGVRERPVQADQRYVGFLDAAGGSGRDSFAAAVAHVERSATGETVVVLDAVREIRPPFDPLAVTGELAAVLKSYGVTVAQADRFAGSWVSESFARHGVTIMQDADPKSQIYLAALPLFTSRRVDLLDLPVLRAQLVGLERRRRAGGRDIVDHMGGAFDDVANAVCGALVLASTSVAGDTFAAANVRDVPRGRAYDDREAEWLGRIV